MQQEVLDVGVAASAAEAGDAQDFVGFGFADLLAPALDATVVAGAAQDGGDAVGVAVGSLVLALTGFGLGSDGFVERQKGDADLLSWGS